MKLAAAVSGRGHLAPGGQPAHVDQFALQVLQPAFGLLPFAEVADEAGEVALVPRPHLADRELHGKGRAVLALADHDAADPDDPSLPGGHVAVEVGVVLGSVRVRHQRADVAADHLRRGPAELPFRCAGEGLHDPALVDDDHGVRHGVQDRLQVGFARLQVADDPADGLGMAQQPFAEQARRHGDRYEHGGADRHVRIPQVPEPDDEHARDEGEATGEHRGSQSADGGARDEGGHEEQEDRIVLEDRSQQDMQQHAHGRGGDRDAVADRRAAPRDEAYLGVRRGRHGASGRSEPGWWQVGAGGHAGWPA
jgi:hypothetical protein